MPISETRLKTLTQSIDIIHNETGLPGFIFDDNGCILFSTEDFCTGETHITAQKVIQDKKTEHIITRHQTRDPSITQEEYLSTICIDGETICGFGIVGAQGIVTPVGKLTRQVIFSRVKELDYEAKLASLEKKYTDFFDNIHDVYFETMIDGKIIMSSPSGSRFSGYPLDELIGNHVDILYRNPDDRQVMLKMLKEEGLVRDLEMVFKRKDGSLYDVSINADLYTNEEGVPEKLKGTIRDITDRRTAERNLKKSEEKFRMIFENAPLGFVHFDKEGKITAINDNVAKIMGSSKDAIIGFDMKKNLSEYALGYLNKALAGEKVTYEGEYNTHTGERNSFVRIIMSPFFSNEGKIEGGISILEDMTEKKRTQELLVQNEKMMSVGGLAAGMAHEINNPLAGMIQNAQVIANRLSKNHPANEVAAKEAGTDIAAIKSYMDKRGIFEQFDHIHTAGKKAAEIVQNMLNFAKKSDSGKIPKNMERLIENTINLIKNDYDLARNYDFKNIKIIRDYADGLPQIACEESKIQQVIINVIKNNIDAFTENCADLKDLVLKFRLTADTEMICMEIEDNGPGMDPKTQKRIFEPFFTTKNVDKGTGLGLSISYFIIVENHKGKMEVKSSPGNGTTFIIKLPINPESDG